MPLESKIWRGSAAPPLARKSTPARAAGRGKADRMRRGGGTAGKKRAAAKAKAPASAVKQVRVGGETVYLHEATYQAAEDPASVDDPHALMPGGGDRDATRLFNEAGALIMRDDHKGATKCYKEILARFPNHYPANYSMGMQCRLAGKPRSAIKYFTRAIMVWPEYHMAYWGMGRTLLDMEEYDAALEMLDKALSIQPDDPLAREDRAEALKALGKRG